MKINILVPTYCLDQPELDYSKYPVPSVNSSILAFTKDFKGISLTVNDVLFDYNNKTITVFAGVMK